jgi:MFS family permease
LERQEESRQELAWRESNVTQKGKGFLSLLGVAHSLNHSLFLVAPPLLIIIGQNLLGQNLEANSLVLGVVGTITSFIYGTGSLVAGLLSDRTGEVKVISLALVLAGASTFLLLFAKDIIIYSLALFLTATWASLYHPTANSLISKEFDQQMGEAMGIHGFVASFGGMLTPIVAFTIGIAINWRVSFIFFGLMSIIIGLVISRNRTQTSKEKSTIRMLDVLRMRGVLTILAFNIAVGLYMKGVEYFLPTYLTLKSFQPLGEETAKIWAATAATIVLASGVPGQWLGGRAADRVGSKKVLVTVSAGILAALLFLQYAPSALAFLGVALFVMLYGLCFYGHQPALNSLTGIMTPPERRGAIYGIFFFTSFGLGSVSLTITGYYMRNFGVESSFYVLTVFAAIAFVLSLVIPDKRANQAK